MRLTAERTKKVEVPGDPDNGFINIKALTLEEISKIEAKAATTHISADEGGYITLDSHKRANGIASACLISWGNFFDENDKEIKFNRKNLRKVAGYSVVIDDTPIRFMEWVDNEHMTFLDEVEAETEVAEKN